MLTTALGAAAGLVALAFALSTLERWVAGRQPHHLAWTVALAMFSVASLALAAGAEAGWNGVTFRLFWIFGAVANVPFLAVGTVYLLAGRRTAHLTAATVALAVAFAPSVAFIVFGRFLLGLGVGLASMIVPLYIAEMAPADRRGALVSLNQLMKAQVTCLATIFLLSLCFHFFAFTAALK